MGDAADVAVAWTMPMDPQCRRVEVGDVVTFTWTGNHNVAVVPNMTDFMACANPTVVGALADGGTFSWTADQSNQVICSVSGHCPTMRLQMMVGADCPTTTTTTTTPAPAGAGAGAGAAATITPATDASSAFYGGFSASVAAVIASTLV